jgi:hypothetical protein
MIHRRGMRKLWIFLPLAILAVAVAGFVVMNLWNWLIPALFAGRTITFWQALGVLVLSRLLFSGFGSHRGFGRHRGFGGWERMSPEEREKFRAAIDRHGMHRPGMHHGDCGGRRRDEAPLPNVSA